MKAFSKQIISLLLVLALIVGAAPITSLAEESNDSLAGKKISILGDSISTYEGVSNNEKSNSTLVGGAIYYTPGRLGVYQKDTWWQQTADVLGLEILVNNSWSGSSVLHTRRGTEGAYVDRCVQLHNDHTGAEPDIIVVYMGGNDFNYYQDTLGNADIDYDSLIMEKEDGTFVYAEPATTCEAYAIMLHKMKMRYPKAEIYCMTSTPRRSPDKVDDYPDVGQPTFFNEERKKIVTHLGCTIVDIENCGISKEAEEFDKYIGDGRSHPNAEGMDLISQALCSAILEEKTTLYDVNGEYNAVETDNDVTAAIAGDSYTANLTLQSGYTGMCVSVIMAGQDITEAAYANGKIYIENVTGDIEIKAMAERNPLRFAWKIIDNELVSTGKTENSLTKLEGTVTDGIINDARYQLEKSVILKHDCSWVLEWKCAEDWRGVILSSNPPQLTQGRTYITRTKGGQLCFGSWDGNQYNNYGVDLSDLDSQVHTYRLENRIANDENNMVWLYVDGTEIGPMNNYYVGSKSQKITSDWINGKDFEFSFIGSNTTLLDNCAMEYLEVIECDHIYINGKCICCGEEHPNLANFEGKVISILGDSISTFAGYIPTADGFNLEHLARYPQDNLVTDVNETWWMQIINELDAKLGINDSWRGSTVSGNASVTSGVSGADASMANLTRIQNLGSNGTPDVILFYGGTNDLAHVSKVGTFDSETAPSEVDLTTKSWDNLADGYVNTLLRLQYYYPEAEIVAMLPTYTATYYSDTKLAQANEILANICEYYDVKYVDLRDSGVTAEYLPDGIHPGAEGMDLITASVIELLVEACDIETGENVVHSVKHNLTNVKATHSYIKGISSGNAFNETLTADEEIEVSVKMDGVDITDQCYSEGKITIASVTGELEITAKAVFSLGERLQQLPEEYYGINLWSILRHDDDYYSADGWKVHSSGTVKSVTIPVVSGERIYATSFGAAGTNGSSTSGIRVTFFDKDGVLISMTAGAVYSEFSENGFITVPANAVAVSVPMWIESEYNELYICCGDYVGPVITKQPSDVVVDLGERFSVTVNAEGKGLTYQWYYKNNGGTVFAESSFRSKSYAMKMADYCHNRQIYCVITDENGNSVQTETVTIKAPVTITKQPASVQTEIGNKFSISVKALGDGLTYQWYYKNAGGKNFAESSFKGKSYAMKMADYCHNRQVYCVITDQYGNSVTTETVTITRPPVELKVLNQPTDVYAVKGETFSIGVKAQGEGVIYQWYYKDSYMKDFKISSNKSSSYSYTMQNYHNNRQVYCVITDQYGNQISTNVAAIHLY